jgi:hypothetical protein
MIDLFCRPGFPAHPRFRSPEYIEVETPDPTAGAEYTLRSLHDGGAEKARDTLPHPYDSYPNDLVSFPNGLDEGGMPTRLPTVRLERGADQHREP